jgi:RimJ/RimL family protein N-acetyltransferase
MASFEPEGDPVSTTPSIKPDVNSPSMILHGECITLRPLQVTDAPQLFYSLAGPGNEALWTYIAAEPPMDLNSFTERIVFLCERTIFFPFVLLSTNLSHIPASLRSSIPPEGIPVGVTTLMSIVPVHHSIEIGHVVYSQLLQRSAASTEASYLLMRLAIEELGYERVEWKCNDRNEPSMKAAVRLGFRYEGTFRRHLVVKGRRRDTAWYSAVVEEWEGVKRVLEGWLARGNFGEDGGQREKIEVVRERVLGKGK